MATILELDRLSRLFGSLVVTDEVSLSIEAGEAVGIIGPNGAGKTTLFNLIAGSLRPSRGRILFLGRDITRFSPSARCRAGIGRTFQIPHPFGGMTVFENVVVGAAFGGGRGERDACRPCFELLDRTGLLAKANSLAGSLTLLDRKRLELARALATEPSLLLLDEIAGGLTEPEVRQLVETINGIRGGGVAVLWIEHIVHALTAVVDRLVAMNLGRLIGDGRPAEVMRRPEVREVYLGPDGP